MRRASAGGARGVCESVEPVACEHVYCRSAGANCRAPAACLPLCGRRARALRCALCRRLWKFYGNVNLLRRFFPRTCILTLSRRRVGRRRSKRVQHAIRGSMVAHTRARVRRMPLPVVLSVLETPELLSIIMEQLIRSYRAWHIDCMLPAAVQKEWRHALARARRDTDTWGEASWDIGKLSEAKLTRHLTIGPFSWVAELWSEKQVHVPHHPMPAPWVKMVLTVPSPELLPPGWSRRTEAEVELRSLKDPERVKYMFTRHLFCSSLSTTSAGERLALVDYGHMFRHVCPIHNDDDDDFDDDVEANPELIEAGLRLTIRLRVHPGTRARICSAGCVPHPLELHSTLLERWSHGYRVYCDLCNTEVDETGMHSGFTRSMRRCARGCNFDVCEACMVAHRELLSLREIAYQPPSASPARSVSTQRYL